MISKRAKRELLDKFHRGFVYTMIGVTLVTLTTLGVSFYATIQEVKKKERLMLSELQSKDDPEEFPASVTLR